MAQIGSAPGPSALLANIRQQTAAHLAWVAFLRSFVTCECTPRPSLFRTGLQFTADSLWIPLGIVSLSHLWKDAL